MKAKSERCCERLVTGAFVKYYMKILHRKVILIGIQLNFGIVSRVGTQSLSLVSYTWLALEHSS